MNCMKGGNTMGSGRPLKMILITVLLVLVILPALNQVKAAQTDTIFYIPVKGEVGPAMAAFVSDQLDRAYNEGASVVVLEISTLGGRVDSALDISEAIIASGVPTVA